MKRCLCLILPCLLAACAGSPRPATQTFTPTSEPAVPTTPYSSDTAIPTLEPTATATATLQPSATPFPPVPANAPSCRPADLAGSFNSNGAAQPTLLSLGLTNAGNGPCFLPAWPQVRLLDRQGRLLNVDTGYFDLGLGPPGATATQQARGAATDKRGLWPGWSAWLNLLWQNWCGQPVSGGVIIQLSFNQAPGILKIPTPVQVGGACTAAGQPSHLGISQMLVIPAP